MKLLKVRIEGFRNLANTTLELGGITGLIATNNFGKTNLLDAIEFGASFINANEKIRSAMMADTEYLPLIPSLAQADYRFEVEFDTLKPGDYRYVRYGFTFSWVKDDGTGRRITDEYLEMNSKPGGRWASYIDRKKGSFRKSHSTRSMRNIILDNTTLAIDIIPSLDNIEISTVIAALKSMVLVVCHSIDASSRYDATFIEFGENANESHVINFDDKDLPRSLYYLREFNDDLYDEFLGYIYELFPTFERFSVDSYELKNEAIRELKESLDAKEESNEAVPFRIRDELYRITIKDANLNQPVDISHMSAGTKRIIWLVANAIIARIGKVACLGVEEVETSVHPKMMELLLEILDASKEETSLIVTSHSPLLVQYLKAQQIYIGLPDPRGIARFARLREDKVGLAIDLAYKRGLSLGEYLFQLIASEEDLFGTLGQLVEV